MSLANSPLKKTMPTSLHNSDKMTAEGSFIGGQSTIIAPNAPKSRLSEVLNIIEDGSKNDGDDDDGQKLAE